MKKYVQKILAGIIALAMILGNLTGTGITVARAGGVVAPENDDGYFTEFHIMVLNDKKEAVDVEQLGLVLNATNNSGMGEPAGTVHNLAFKGIAGEKGRAYYKCEDKEPLLNYSLKINEKSGYKLKQPTAVTFDMMSDDTTAIDLVNKQDYDGTVFEVYVTGDGNISEPVVEEKFLEGKVISSNSPLSKVMSLQLSRVDLSGTPVKFSTNESGEFKIKINDLAVGEYKLQPVAGSGYKYSGSQPMKITISTRKDGSGQNEKYISKVDGAEFSGGAVSLSVVEDDSSVITGVMAETKSVDEKGGKITLTVTGRNLSNSLYYKKYYVKSDGKNKNDVLLANEKAQKISAQGNTDTKKTVEVTLPNASEYVGAAVYPSVSAWKIGVDVSADGLFLADARSNEIEIKKAPVQSGGNSDNDKTDTPAKKKVKVSKIKITGDSKKIAAGKSIQLKAAVSPAKATNKAVKWTVSNKKYAKVTSKGKVTVYKAGAGKTVTVTATAKDGSKKKGTYKIQIMKNTVKSIKLKAAKTVKAGKKITVKATVKTTGKKANKTLKWTSSNTKYATVTAKGVVKAQRAGKNKTVKITARATDGSNKKYTVKIKIK